MKVLLHLPRAIGNKDYPKGLHEMHDDLHDNSYLRILVRCGHAVIVEAPKNELKSEDKITDESVEASSAEKNEVDASNDSEVSPELDESVEDQSTDGLSDAEESKNKKSNTRQSHNKKGR